MSHKEECICYCIDHLNSRNLSHVYNKQLFHHYYRKHNGTNGNAFSIGLNAADFMIQNFEPKKLYNDDVRRNESEAGEPERA